MSLTKLTSSQVTYKQGGTDSKVRSLGDKLREVVSVKDFGAVGNGVADDSVAFNAALDAAKGTNGNAVGRSVFAIYVPTPAAGGFYRIENTLVIDGTHGLHIYGDAAQSQRSVIATLIWKGSTSAPIFQLKGGTGTPSNPNFNIKIENLTISGTETDITPGSTPPASLALSGIHFGNLDTQNDNTLNRNISIENVSISNCRFGIWSGNPEALNTDHASVYLTNSNIYNCVQAGILWGTGNAILNAIGNHVVNNGWGGTSYAADDYSAQIGANVHVNSGYVDLISYTSAGAGTAKPSNADVYQNSGRLSIINAWSDTHGYFLYSGGASEVNSAYMPGQITGVRHYEGSMDASNTPSSMYIRVPGTVVSACLVYGNIEVISGLGGKPVFAGINFIRTGATFTGSGVDTQRSLINIGSGGNFSQIQMGGTEAGTLFTDIPAMSTAHLLMRGDNPIPFQALGADSTGTGCYFSTRTDDANGSQDIIINAFYDGAWKAMQANKPCWLIQFGSYSGIAIYTGYSGTAGGNITFTEVGKYLLGGNIAYINERVFVPPKLAGEPTFSSGDYWEGGLYYNTTTNKLRVNTGGGTWVDLH